MEGVESRPRILATAFAPVPGTNPHGAALMAMVAAVRAEIDLVTVKTENLSHVERVGEGRMFRVPVGDGDPLEQREAFDRAVARQLQAERYDVVHVRGPFEGALAAQRKAELGFQLVYEMATFPDEALGAEVEKLWAEVHARCLAQADLVIVPTEAAKRALAETHPAVKIEVLPPGVDVGTLDWRPPTLHGTARILYLGTFTADRELPTVLDAIRRVRAARDVRVLLAGDPDRSRRDRLRQVVEAYGLRDCVDVRGEPSAVAIPGVIAAADVCLAPAAAAPRFQTLGDLPQPLLEYMACRRPVIAAAVPGVGEVLRDERDGLVYPPGDDETLAAAILEILGSPKTAERLTEGGYRRVRDLFSSGARRRRIAEIYARILPGLEVGDPWVLDFEEEEIGPSDADIEAAEAALRGEIEPSSTGMEAVEALEPSASDLEPITSDSGIEGDASLVSEPGIESSDLTDAVVEELASDPTSSFSITDVGLESPPTNPRIDTDPGTPIAAERTHPGT
ncbi:MAG: hypothetical protein OHK0013_37010 [Sandaracinaceae bacterium]